MEPLKTDLSLFYFLRLTRSQLMWYGRGLCQVHSAWSI